MDFPVLGNFSRTFIALKWYGIPWEKPYFVLLLAVWASSHLSPLCSRAWEGVSRACWRRWCSALRTAWTKCTASVCGGSADTSQLCYLPSSSHSCRLSCSIVASNKCSTIWSVRTGTCSNVQCCVVMLCLVVLLCSVLCCCFQLSCCWLMFIVIVVRP